MRTGAAAGHHGYFHEAVCYDSDEHLLGVVVPFLRGGVAAGEPTVVALGERNAALVRDAMPDDSPVVYLTGAATYTRPAAAIRSYRRILTGHMADGAAQIRIIGELPAATFGPGWDCWARYESAINHAYDDFPLWSMCAYDVRRTPEPVLADVARTHPRTALPGDRHLPSPAYVDPRLFLAERRPAPPDPLQRVAPRLELADPTASQARQAVRAAAPAGLPADQLADLIVAVSETVSNAHRHGLPPTRMRIWSGTDRMVITVTDRGSGPKDPFAGLLPAGGPDGGGLGLWITHQSCEQVTLSCDEDGFTVRLTAGP
ncbi:sensor histidine kinase [Actinoplanes teichomyceticus]|uniref:Anti-sigma regulatory factor (Ser/Thr protein kinase) n=1 Tax=Actinoplanes teichomyceticus TaxID=1867 RepID=A0A561VIR5_ACTTI|nr:sensor histidine kinase [Actinoplanes teichomyceticus]TWG11506.1 anti-sigma regulatory factor (Ser/Thr protein kinase) [Actinoplanes teichomyceticus]GIF15680.1 anti-sigma regulatory factor [Actinoplanes teichomyceticus]